MSSRTETSSLPPAPAPVPRWTAAALILGWTLVVLLFLYFLELAPRLRTEAPSVDTVPTVQAGFPAPPVGAVVYARRMGGDALALGVVPQAGRVIVQASVVGPQGDGVSGLDVTFGARGATAEGRSCGAGCYRAELATAGRPRAVDLVVAGDSTTRWSVPLPQAWPPQSASGVLDRAGRVWRSLDSLS